MEVQTIGNFTFTVCSHCEELISVPGKYSSDIGDALRKHLADRRECQQYYDDLPSMDEVIASIHADHDCKPAKCICKCGCDVMMGCTEVFGPLCSVCMIRASRDEGDGPHGCPAP